MKRDTKFEAAVAWTINLYKSFVLAQERPLASNYNRNSSAITKRTAIYLASKAWTIVALSDGREKLPT